VILDEIEEDLKGRKPSCIAMSVGGGGMLMGILLGMERAGWKDVPILALETEGANCFRESLLANRIVDVAPTSIAKTLGCRTPAPALLEKAQEFKIISKVLPDKAAAEGSILLSEDHGMMVEPACGVTLAAVYSNILPAILEREGYSSAGPIVLIVCGGSDITLEVLRSYEDKYEIHH
jgi:L-serine/L-threonine ammonia-lyase